MKTSLLLHCALEYGFSCLFSLSQEALDSMSSKNENSFVFKTDKNGHEYAALSHTTKKIGGMK